MNDVKKAVMTNWRWVMCAMLFFATTVNYMDRQVLSLTFKEFIQPPLDRLRLRNDHRCVLYCVCYFLPLRR